jgi:hypothetical protein
VVDQLLTEVVNDWLLFYDNRWALNEISLLIELFLEVET